MLLALARRLCRNRSDAEELTQDTIVRALERRQQHLAASSVRGWLITILWNLFRDRCRREARRIVIPIDDVQVPFVEPEAAPGWTQVTKDDLATALLQLDEDSRAVFVLFQFEKRSYDEIADLLRIKVSTVGTRLMRTREKLEKAAPPRGGQRGDTMTNPCEQVHAFADGQLKPDEALAFVCHIDECPRCQVELHDLLQLAGLAEELGAAASAAGAKVDRLAAVAHPVSVTSPRWWRPSRRTSVVFALGAAAVVTLVLVHRPVGPAGDAALAELVAGARVRSLEARLSRPEVDRFRPYEVSLGGPGGRHSSLAGVPRLEQRGDLHGAAIAYVLAGDLRQASRYLEDAGLSIAVRNDRAVVALGRGALEEALVLIDGILASEPRHPQALWNRALTLRELGLEMLAAETFDRVVDLAEPGWSQEARDRAADLRRRAEASRQDWNEARKAGDDMVTAGALPGDALLRAHPGVLRLSFYDAVRVAPSRERVLALRRVAGALDRSFGGDVLTRHVERVAAADFAVRAPLSALYHEVWTEPRRLQRRDREVVFTRLRKAPAPDILLGTLFLTDSIRDHLDEYRELAQRSGDPWFLAIAELTAARAEVARGELRQAERRLVDAIPACHAQNLEYRCASLEDELANLYLTFHRPLEAQATALAGWKHAHQAGEWGFEAIFLQDLAGAAVFHHASSLARAYLDEVALRRVNSCDVGRYVRIQQAMLSLRELDHAGARAAFARAPVCKEPLPLGGVDLFGELAHFGVSDVEVAFARAALFTLREGGTLTPGQLAEADEIEGRLLVERDVEAARPLLERAIERAAARPAWDIEAQKARSFSFSALVQEAGRRGAWEEALALLAREAGVAAPAECALGLALDFDQLVVVARLAGGLVSGRYEPHRRGALEMGRVVDDEVKRGLAACPVVDVFARPPFQGHADLLPAEIAWRYRTTAGARGGASPSLAPRRLVVSGVEAPASLDLPRLRPFAPSGGAAGEQLMHVEGAGHPGRILDEMVVASEMSSRARAGRSRRLRRVAARALARPCGSLRAHGPRPARAPAQGIAAGGAGRLPCRRHRALCPPAVEPAGGVPAGGRAGGVRFALAARRSRGG